MTERTTPSSFYGHFIHAISWICFCIFVSTPGILLRAGDEVVDFDNLPFIEDIPYSPANTRFDQKSRYLFLRDFGSYRFLQKNFRLFIDEVGTTSSASLPDNGTNYARDLTATTPITIVRVDGQPFQLRSLEIAEYSSIAPQPVTISITGVKGDLSEVTASFVSDGRFDGSGPLEDFETLTLSDDFADLLSVDIETNGGRLDNFHLSGPDFLPPVRGYPERPVIFDLTWESDKFPEYFPPVTGGFDAPSLVKSLPLVVESSSAFTGKSLILQRNHHPEGWISEHDEPEGFVLSYNANASSYYVSANLLISQLNPPGGEEKLSISLTTSPYAISIYFNSDGTISFSVSHHSDEETIGNFTFGTALDIGIRVDRKLGTILIEKDGQTVHTESLGAPMLDITTTEVLLHSGAGSSSSVEVADFRITGNEIPLFYESRGPIPEVPVLQPSATPFLYADVGVAVSRSIVIKNIGDEELRIDAIELTPSSLQLEAELPLFISPGESDTITVSYTGEDPSLGRQYGDIYVYSNSDISPIRRSFEFLTKGHGSIAVLPQSVNRVMRANSQSTFTLDLAYYGINPSYSFNIQFPAEGQDLPVPTTPITPNDPLFSTQWHHRTPTPGSPGIDTTRAWSVTRGSPLVVVAVVDTGVNFDHPDLGGNKNHKNPGYDFLDNDNDPSDPSLDPFGTFVAGVIAAVGDNEEGGAGVASNVKIMALRYIDADRGIGFASDAADCITYAADNGANVINNSWGSNNYSGAIFLAIETALRKGVTVVNSAGNGGYSNDLTPYYPASYQARSLGGTDDTIAVAASDGNDNLTVDSNFGAVSVDVAAPGSNILGTWRSGTYDTDSGTRQSTAIVSGVAALLYSQDRLITPHDVKTAILSSVDKVASMNGKVASGGRVNAARALEQRAREWLSTPDGGASSLARGETAQAEFTIDTTGLAPGRYSKNIFFYETTTLGLSGEIPLTIDVIGDITDPPTILQQQSVAAEAYVGKTTSLRIEVLGEPITYQWYRGSPGDTSDPVGGDSETFVTEEHVSPGTEKYWVRLTNANGHTDSSEYVVDVMNSPPHAPGNISATSGTFPDRVKVSWSPVPGADSYEVYRSADWNFAAAARVAFDLNSTTFDDSDVDEGELFYYWVIAKGAGGSSRPGGPNGGRISLEVPTSLSQLEASDGTERNSVRLNWDRAADAISYDVFRSATARFEDAVLLGSTHATEWRDTDHTAPGSYFYWVRARNPDHESPPTVSALSHTGHSTPDVWVISRKGISTGNGTHSAKDGISNAGIRSKSFSRVSYTTYLKNEGSMTDSYLMSFRTSKADVVTTHIDRATGSNISAALIAGTWKSDLVSSGELRTILSTTRPSGRMIRSKRRSFTSMGIVTGRAELSFPTPDSVGLRYSFVRKIRKRSNRQ